jgi:hypothetical protein
VVKWPGKFTPNCLLNLRKVSSATRGAANVVICARYLCALIRFCVYYFERVKSALKIYALRIRRDRLAQSLQDAKKIRDL